MVNVIITAPKGKMNSLILEEAVKCPDIEVVGTIGPKGRDYIGTEICGVKVYDDLDAVIDKCDLVVDFSGANIAMDVLDVCLAHNKALLEGSTGFTSEMNRKIEDVEQKDPAPQGSEHILHGQCFDEDAGVRGEEPAHNLRY